MKWLINQGFLRSERIKEAMLKVQREEFVPPLYRDYAYLEVLLPLPGEKATISCPHSYPLFYEPLGLDIGHKFLEVGVQNLVLLEKSEKRIIRKVICEVLYIPLRGKYGVSEE